MIRVTVPTTNKENITVFLVTPVVSLLVEDNSPIIILTNCSCLIEKCNCPFGFILSSLPLKPFAFYRRDALVFHLCPEVYEGASYQKDWRHSKDVPSMLIIWPPCLVSALTFSEASRTKPLTFAWKIIQNIASNGHRGSNAGYYSHPILQQCRHNRRGIKRGDCCSETIF